MAVMNILLLASTVLPAVLAIPQHAHHGHGLYKRNELPSGFPTGFPHPSGVPGTAPYPAQNATIGGPTGTGRGPVTIQSTINIVPLPVTHTQYATSSTGGVGEAGATGSAGTGNSGSNGSGSPSGGSGSGVGESGAECGPATVTVTHANTVTVTVGGSSGGAASNAPIDSSAVVPSIPAAPSSAPYPVGNSSVPAGSTDTGSVGSVLPSIPTQVPVPTSPLASSSAAPVEIASSAAPVVSSSAPAEAASSAASAPAPAVSSSAPVEAASSAASSPAAVVPTSSVEAHAYYHVPGGDHHSPAQPVAPASSSVSFPAPVASSSVSSAPAVQATTSAPAPVVSSAASSAPASSSSSAPVKSNSGGKARGLLYGGPDASTALANANAYLSAGSGAMGWGWNWDSSPSPASGHATGTLNVQFVPMLLSAIDTHTSLWDGNSAGYPYLMGFNEPDMTTDKGGSQMDVDTCVSNWMTYMEPKKSGSVKLISPATTNNLDDTSMGIHYMSNFLDKCKAKGCSIDVLAFHYYGKADDLEYFKSTVSKYKDLQSQHGIAELWITEMAPTELPTKDQMDAFLAYLDGESGVSRYAFNGLNTGTGQSLDNGVIKSAYCS